MFLYTYTYLVNPQTSSVQQYDEESCTVFHRIKGEVQTLLEYNDSSFVYDTVYGRGIMTNVLQDVSWRIVYRVCCPLWPNQLTLTIPQFNKPFQSTYVHFALSLFPQKRTPLEVSLLQFFFAYVQRTPGAQLVDSWPALLSLLKEGLQINLTPPGQFLLLGSVLCLF